MILRVDLSTECITREPVPGSLREMYLGGEGINARLLWDHFLGVDPRIDPKSPDNVLIAGVGPMVGTCFGSGSKMKFTFKSPAYGIYGDSTVGGDLGSQLRWAGFSHLVITGKAEHPVYLCIRDEDVQIKDARHLWGKTTSQTNAAIKEELADREVETACIGPAGENQVHVASIIAGGHRAAGRGGGGCVMGSKNLKAIAARGTKGIPVHDPPGLLAAVAEFQQRSSENPAMDQHMRYGTLQTFSKFHGMGFNTYRNGQGRMMPDSAFKRLDHTWYRDNLGARSYACSSGCSLACGHFHQIKAAKSTDGARTTAEWGTRPEYAAANAFGASCDCPDMIAVSKFNSMCNQHGMDIMEIGMTISFLMELWEREIIAEEDIRQWTGGERLSLAWGNQEAISRIIDTIALQANELGEILGSGVYQAAVKIGESKCLDLRRYANYGKAGATHEGPARAWPALSIACAVASVGAHHLKGLGVKPGVSNQYFGRPDAADALSPILKGAGHAVGENLMAITNSLGFCKFLSTNQMDGVPLELISRAIEAVTGLALTHAELVAAGERVVNIEKAFNSRLGLRREDDTLCERWLSEPQLEGVAQGVKAGDFLEDAKDEYYAWRGWDVTTAMQTKAKLAELNMLDVADVLTGEAALATEPAGAAIERV